MKNEKMLSFMYCVIKARYNKKKKSEGREMRVIISYYIIDS